MNQLSSTKKGLITGALMVIISMIVFKFMQSFDNNLPYVSYGIYTAGIIWSIITFAMAAENKLKFVQFFAEGFKCFIVVTLMMVVFYILFIYFHPELKDAAAIQLKAGLLAEKDKTPQEIDEILLRYKKNYITGITSITIFGYLIIGALISSLTSAILLARQNEQSK